MSKVREHLEQLKRDLENHTIYKEGLPGSTLDIVNALLADLEEDEAEEQKKIPKKPIDKTKPDDTASQAYENCHIVVCPACGGRLKLKSKGRYCDKCGQALDWKER
nr:MAG TPA: Trm112p-like protein [Caudoviricetes sp.]